MTHKKDIALALAGQGFHVFPLAPQSKLPDIDAWQKRATTDTDQIEQWWTCPVTGMPQERNIGICTSRFGPNGEALVVVDVDNKGDVQGNDTLLELEFEGATFPPTLEGRTPTGGRHLIYYATKPVNHRKAGFLGPGLDIRSRGGYIVGPGSDLEAGQYDWRPGSLKPAPKWLVHRLGTAEPPKPAPEAAVAAKDDAWATTRAEELIEAAEEASEGVRNDEAYRLACRLRDLGLTEGTAADYLAEWNLTRCLPPLDDDELDRTVRSAWRTAQNPQGSARPEADFQPAETPGEDQHPFDKMNEEYALVIAGGGHHILWETTGEDGEFELQHLSEQAFHRYHASYTMQVGKKREPVTKCWMGWDGRRTYKGLCFRPGRDAPEGYYNLWRGFRVTPADTSEVNKKARDGVAMFHEHALENVCRGDETLYQWLMQYFAHMVQRPEEKPLVALVFRGGKGTGKNALVDRVGALLGSHYLLTSNRRYLTGNFNSHLERMLFFVLDEAFWSGDKAAEGQLKDLVTGRKHVIEHKGKEPYTVDNLTRVAILGNEEWVVPATEDERRWAVFDIGNGRRQDRAFFTAMREGIDEEGGSRLLLKQLLEWPVDGMDVNRAPSTPGLVHQKIASLEPLAEWWYASLGEGSIIGLLESDFEGWPEQVQCKRVYDAFIRHAKARGIRSRLPEQKSFGRQLKNLCPSMHRRKNRDGDDIVWTYFVPRLDVARRDFEKHIGQELPWDEDDD